MVTVFRQKEPLTDSQIYILAYNYCNRYNAWDARNKLKEVLKIKGESNYDIYKCLCKYKDQMVEEKPKSLHCQMKYDPNFHLFKDIDTNLMYQKLEQSWKKKK